MQRAGQAQGRWFPLSSVQVATRFRPKVTSTEELKVPSVHPSQKNTCFWAPELQLVGPALAEPAPHPAHPQDCSGVPSSQAQLTSQVTALTSHCPPSAYHPVFSPLTSLVRSTPISLCTISGNDLLKSRAAGLRDVNAGEGLLQPPLLVATVPGSGPSFVENT